MEATTPANPVLSRTPSESQGGFFTPPEGDPLAAENVDQRTGKPLWIASSDPTRIRWWRLQTTIQLEDRFMDQTTPVRFRPPRFRGDPHIGPTTFRYELKRVAPAWMPTLQRLHANLEPLEGSRIAKFRAGTPTPEQRRLWQYRSKRELATFTAWARDVAGLSVSQLCLAMYAEIEDPDRYHVNEEDTQAVKYQARTGRKFYCDSGVLPWAAYRGGKVPAGWFDDGAFRELANEWAASC